jgi:putative transcriptional regulator
MIKRGKRMKQKKRRSPFFERIKAGLEEILLHAQGKIKLKTYVVEVADPPPSVDGPEIAVLRDRLKLTQLTFASLLNVPLGTIRLWETGDRKPSGAAARLLQIYSERPEIVEFITNGKNGSPAPPSKRKKVASAKTRATTRK